MRTSNFTALSILSLATGSLARLGNRLTASGDGDLLSQKSRVTSFVLTDAGLKVECWEIGDFIPDQVIRTDGSKGTVSRMSMEHELEGIDILTWPEPDLIWPPSSGSNEVRGNAIDFRAQPNLFTVKDGLILIETWILADAAANAEEETYVFADVNGDDWFYFEDDTTDDTRASSQWQDGHGTFNIQTVSGSETTVLHFKYTSTPRHRVLHEGRCNFAGLKPVPDSGKHDPDAEPGLHVQPSEL